MSRRVALIVVGAAVSLLFAVVATGGEVEFAEPTSGPRVTADVVVDDRPPPTVELPEILPDESDSTRGRIPATILLFLAVSGAALIVLWALYALRDVLARLPRLVWRRDPGDAAFDVLPDVAAAVVGEADSQRAELLAGEARNAIVRCWLRLERDVASAGLVRHRSQTSAEFTESVLAGYSVDGEAIRSLARLYREARFSQHDLDESSRREALDALERLHDSLVDGAPDPSALDEATAGGVAADVTPSR